MTLASNSIIDFISKYWIAILLIIIFIIAIIAYNNGINKNAVNKNVYNGLGNRGFQVYKVSTSK